MSTKKISKQTYSYDQRRILLLKEAYLRDLHLFKDLLLDAPKAWTFTVITKGPSSVLVVNTGVKPANQSMTSDDPLDPANIMNQ